MAAEPSATEDELAKMVATIRDAADHMVPISYQLVGIGDRLPYYTATKFGFTGVGLREAGAVGLLDANPAAAADQLIGLELRLGINELVVPGELADAFAPVLARLR